jgi:hypothetical protein
MTSTRDMSVSDLLGPMDTAAAADEVQMREARRLLARLPADQVLPASSADVPSLLQTYRQRAARPSADPAVAEVARRLEIIGWGELYRTHHDAENHIFE